MKKTERGYEFLDAYGDRFMITSPLMNGDEHMIWLGTEGPQACLTQSQVAALLPMLMRFALVGELVDREIAIIVFEIPSDGEPHISNVLGDFTIPQLQEIEQAFITSNLEYPEDATGVVCEVLEIDRELEPDGPGWLLNILGHDGTEHPEDYWPWVDRGTEDEDA